MEKEFSLFKIQKFIKVRRTLSAVFAGGLALLFIGQMASANDDIDWSRWAQNDPASTAEVLFKPLNDIFTYITVDVGRKKMMNYSALRAVQGRSYVGKVKRYLEKIPVSLLNRDEQLAYWLNLHNLGVIYTFIVSPKAEKKVKNMRGKPGAPGEGWSKKIFTIEGQALSLEDIEQNILFRHWQDPFLLYGLNYGVRGSAKAALTVFSGKMVHAQLKKNGQEFVNNKGNVKVRRKGLEVSSLYVWNKAVLFNNDDAALVTHIQSLADKKLASKMNANTKVVKDKFSWRSIAFVQRRRSGNFQDSSGYDGVRASGAGS